MISSRRFHGRISTMSGRSRWIASGEWIGMWVPGQQMALLVRIEIAGELHELRPDAAVVEHRVALRGSAVAGDPQALALAGRSGTRGCRACPRPPPGRRRGRSSSRSSPAARSRSRKLEGATGLGARIVVVRSRRSAASRRGSAAPRRRTGAGRARRRPRVRSATRSRRSARGRSCPTGARRSGAAGAGTPS